MRNLLVIGASPGYAFSLGTLLVNLSQTSPNTFDQVLIFADDLTERDKGIISTIFPTDFRRYESPLSSKAIRRSPYLKFFTPYVLAKLETFKYLEYFDSVSWLDNDIVILNPIDSLLNFGPSGASFVPTQTSLGDQLRYPSADFDLEKVAPAGGTFAISRDFAEGAKIYEAAIKLAEKYAPILYLPDQAVMGMAFQKLDLQWDDLDQQIFAPHPNDAPADALIHHPFGPKKFWSGLTSSIWESHYRNWRTLGGSPISSRARNSEFFRIKAKLGIRVSRGVSRLMK